MGKSNNKIRIIALLSIPLSAGIALVPVLSNLAAAFPEQHGSIQMLITIPSLFMMVSSLLTGRLAKRTSMPFITAISIAVIMVAGISPYWINGFAYLLITRGLMGIGLGLLQTATASLPALYFDDGKMRDHAVGIQSAFVCAGGIVFYLLSGAVANSKWEYVFLVQALNIVPLLAAILFMPKIENKMASELERQKIFTRNAMPVAAVSFLIIAFTCTYPLNLSLFVEKQGLGGSQFASLLTSVNSAIGFFVGLIFGKVHSKIKAKTLSLGLVLTAAALLIIAVSPGLAILLAGSVCFGIGTSFISPSLYAMLYERVAPEEVVSSAAMLGIACNISQFVSPFIINPVAKAADGIGAEGTRLILASIFVFLLAIFLAFWDRKKSRHCRSV